MYNILEEFTMKYRKDSVAVFTEETAEKILKAGAFIEKIEEPPAINENASLPNENLENEETKGKDAKKEKTEN